jgi:hypothetical protein
LPTKTGFFPIRLSLQVVTALVATGRAQAALRA